MPTEQNTHLPSSSEHLNSVAPPQHKGVSALVWIIVLLVFAGGFYLVMRKRDASATAAKSSRGGGGPVSLVTATATQGNIGVYLDSIGTVTPVYTASITSQVNGIVTDVHYKEGQLVRKGDPLIDVDPRPYEASLLQAEGTLERDTNLLAQYRMDLERYRDAWARNAIPKQTLDDQEKLVLQQQGTVKFDEGVVRFDQIQVGFCHIVSPISGRVGLRLVDLGNVVQSTGTLTLAVVAQIQPITVIFTVPEDFLGQVQQPLRKNAKLAVDAFDRSALKQTGRGTLITLDNQIDTTTGTVKARASFENKDAALFPNEFVNVRLLVDTHHGATLIPSSAIQHNGKTAFVYVLQDNVAHMRVIQPGVTDAGTTEVTGISPGDVLANSSFDKLQDNAKVVVSSKPTPGNNAGSTAP